MSLDKYAALQTLERAGQEDLMDVITKLLLKKRQDDLEMTHPSTRRMILILEEGLPGRSDSAKTSTDFWRLDPPILSKNGFQT